MLYHLANYVHRMADLKKVVVTGASGRVGQFVVQRLIDEGIQVRATQSPNRHSSLKESLQTSPLLETVVFDLRCPNTADALLAECDALVHCAFAHAPGRYRGGEGSDAAGFWRANLLATQALLDASGRCGTSRVVLLSSRAVYGGQSSKVVSDASPVAPDSHYGALKRAEESLLAIASRRYGFDGASLRATGIYGVLTDISESKWFKECKQVTAGQPITEVRAGTEVHGDDLADALWRLLRVPAGTLASRIFNCSDQWVSSRMLARELNQLTDQELVLPDPVPPETVQGVMRCDGLASLGWQPAGYARVIDVLKELLSS